MEVKDVKITKDYRKTNFTYRSDQFIRGLPLLVIDIIINVDWNISFVDSRVVFRADKISCTVYYHTIVE